MREEEEEGGSKGNWWRLWERDKVLPPVNLPSHEF